MHLQERIQLLVELGKYMKSNESKWQQAKERASLENAWFIPEFIHLAAENISSNWLQEIKLRQWIDPYGFSIENPEPKNIGLIMAGNIPLVGFHDFMSVFISGHKQIMKPSSKDQALIRQLVEHLIGIDRRVREWVQFADMLRGCDAYIATGSNNSSRYFNYYFSKYPNIIRSNRTSVAVLNGNEPIEELIKLADDVHLYFGLGCRNVTKIYVPREYDFLPLLDAFKKFSWFADHNKYKNNYDYQLTLLILNKKYYMTNGSILLAENRSAFSPISLLHYEYYSDAPRVSEKAGETGEMQCCVGAGFLPFGKTQTPGLEDFADGVDTLKFLHGL
ncbi:MAG: acyl-CoA reductase [Chitinophagales bacterium]